MEPEPEARGWDVQWRADQPGGDQPRAEKRRGEELRRHILLSAKDVFLETGFERTSMDVVAARAATSKRSLYAHFESKDKLFLAVLDLIRELYLGRLETPDVFAEDPVEAVTLFCGRFLELMVWEPQVRTCRLTMAEAKRLPGSSKAYYDAIFATATERLAMYLVARYALDRSEGSALADDIVARVVLPRLFRTLLEVEDVVEGPPADAGLGDHVDVDAIRRLVSMALPN